MKTEERVCKCLHQTIYQLSYRIPIYASDCRKWDKIVHLNEFLCSLPIIACCSRKRLLLAIRRCADRCALS